MKLREEILFLLVDFSSFYCVTGGSVKTVKIVAVMLDDESVVGIKAYKQFFADLRVLLRLDRLSKWLLLILFQGEISAEVWHLSKKTCNLNRMSFIRKLLDDMLYIWILPNLKLWWRNVFHKWLRYSERYLLKYASFWQRYLCWICRMKKIILQRSTKR